MIAAFTRLPAEEDESKCASWFTSAARQRMWSARGTRVGSIRHRVSRCPHLAAGGLFFNRYL